jgi:tetratricopeptide (TPR) repeat protein
MSLNGYREMCFVDMPFGKKTDLATGVEIDFDKIYHSAIKPAIEEIGLEPIRGDEELTGGIIHTTMFARLLLSEYVVADLTLANPNVFYELGIRHAAKPFTTVPIYANIHPLPFDVSMIRAIGYRLEKGILSDEAIQNLKSELMKRIQQAINGPPTNDSPLFELIPKFPVIELPHEVTDVFREQVQHNKEFHKRLDEAKSKPSNKERCMALWEIQKELGDLRKTQVSVLVDLMLSFRSVEAWEEMTNLCEAFPEYLKNNVFVCQQWAFSLNRRNKFGDRDKAISLLTKVIEKYGPDPETLGILGRIHKDRYREAKEKGDITALAALDDSISAYIMGFKSDPRDYYPGVNAVTLLIEKGNGEALKKAEQLVPLISFAVARRGGASSTNYWDLATTLELNCISSDWVSAIHILPKVLDKAEESWMPKTTLGNLTMLKQAYIHQGRNVEKLQYIIRQIDKHISLCETGRFSKGSQISF